MATKKISKTKKNLLPTIVAIGASAGGLAAFEAFFSSMRSDVATDIAFVLIQHLSPDHKSLLTDIIRHYTQMEVFEVEDGMRVVANCVYVIPPNREMAIHGGYLQLFEPSAPHGQRLPIDFFFQSLAQDQHERSIAIVLSGTGSDGTKGIAAIKSEGGIVLAQELDSAEYDGMPHSAIETGLVDYILTPDQMPNKIIASLNPSAKKPHTVVSDGESKDKNSLTKIFILLRDRTGHDFSQYKPSTMHRRIERRMAVQRIEKIDEYVKFLQQTPEEVDALFNDLLIGVTNFFRDPEAFIYLKEVVFPKMLALKPAGSTIRIWTTGCSTGEEAYSIAILLKECMEAMKQNYAVQLFATDIDAKAIAIARSGLYPSDITSNNVSPERLSRFFTPQSDGSGYRIHKSIRDMLVFSEQNIIKDPPFSKLDLLSCRNLMIYMSSELQKRLIPLFHYALNPDGILFLGSSESIGEYGDLFSTLDQSSKIYQRKEDIHIGTYSSVAKRFFPATITTKSVLPHVVEKNTPSPKIPLRELTEQALLQQSALTGVLVNAQGDILYLHGRSGMYLELPSGESNVNNILKMAREGLRRDLSSALHKATLGKQIVQREGLSVTVNERVIPINITIRPLALTSEEPLYLVIIEEHPSVTTDDTLTCSLNSLPDTDERIKELKHELHTQEEFLNAANSKLEISNEELKSFNEEMQSLNEELQSTNEELETSKEELQSVNEELSTVNAELQTKVADLSRSNNDMNNLLAGTGIGTVFVDHNLCILRFTPAITQIIHLILSDLGRPVGHIASNLIGYDRLIADTQSVLDTLVPKEVEVQTVEKMWYTLRIQPYRTLDNVIEGAVISFVNITETVQMREALRHANELSRLSVVVRDAHDAITVQDLDGHILAWNKGAVRMYGWSEDEALRMNVNDRIPQPQRKNALAKLHDLSQDEILQPYRTERITKKGTIVEVWMTSTALMDEKGKMYAIATTERAREPKP
ncbi:chemotaxis protein CheB [Sulfuricurvum sp.]|uniref:chemotaxis protein CheB n=1 Tax=Sulfuricurvum sp. TaxID=2025608 RepID=UPI003563EE87